MRSLLLLPLFALFTPAALPAQENLSTVSAATHPEAVYHTRINQIYSAEYLENAPQLRTALLELLRDRVSYVVEPASVNDKYPLISSQPLMNRMNPAIVPHNPAEFNAAEFNPLIYGWDFFSDKQQAYRIDGTDYLLIIEPQ